jgi:hypothetical protein
MKTESIIISGADTARLLTAALVEDSMWFSVDPLADKQYVVMVKDEDLCRVVARLRGLHPGEDRVVKTREACGLEPGTEPAPGNTSSASDEE